ncbi:hypothetical protein [Gloeothece verrucosa]|uniref:Uncharacterized protein n=1 Tax=Gloeothece verrucosa (strain PCC 7822) TaxID=497965 RepID=E0UNE0_GLOV7|nr:hypothetical protein [Gloeothece verrucosa]ADN18470.1 conserved hypothetical protein [Gloeothece verrucosa PCC 7822]
MTKIGIKTIRLPGGKKQRLKPFEDNFDLITYVEYCEGGKNTGATVLKKKNKESYKIVGGVDVRGISPLGEPDQLMGFLSGISSGIKDLPKGETLTLHFGIFVDDTTRQRELLELQKKTDSPVLQLLLGGARKRTRGLTLCGIRKQNFSRIYYTYTVEEGVNRANTDVFENILIALENGWHKFTGADKELKTTAVQQILLDGYHRGFNRFINLLSEQMYLVVRPLTVEQLWEIDWGRFNNTPARPLSQKVVVEKEEFTEEINSRIHPLSLLLNKEVPFAYRDCVKSNGKFTGVCLWADKPDGWIDGVAQLKSVWEVMSRPNVYDTEIFVQLQSGNERLLKDKMNSLTKQAQVAATHASSKNNTDVGAELRISKTIEVEAALIEGEKPIWSSIVFLIHRNSKKELNRACDDFCSLFQQQSWVVRETEYAWSIWLETFPTLTWKKLLTSPFNRRISYLSYEIPGQLPLVSNSSLDKGGFEFIASEGGTPICLNLYESHRNILLFGRQRTGKSSVVSDMLIQGLVRGLPITALDFPRPDGTGTFNDLCRQLPTFCKYVDTGDLEEGINALEPPNLQGLAPKEKKDRFSDFKESLREILKMMILGIDNQYFDINPDMVNSLLTLALEEFYTNPDIKARFALAFRKGFGTQEWKGMPTLIDFKQFLSLERLRLIDPDTTTVKALKFCKLRLDEWLRSRLGEILSKPTTFNSDTQMLVIALRNLKSNLDAAVIASLAYLGALRRSLTFNESIFFLDEAPILFEFGPISINVGRLCANGAKSGIRVILNSQEPLSIAKSAGADKILANMTTKLIGRIESQSIVDYCNVFRYPEWLISDNALLGFKPNSINWYSNWLLDDQGFRARVRHYPSPELLGLIANNPRESQLRKKYLEQFDGDVVRAIFELAKLYQPAA